MEIFLELDTWLVLLTLVFLEIVLAIDNIIFITITTAKLPIHLQKKATRIGLSLAMISRIVLIFGISLIMAMDQVLFEINLPAVHAEVTSQSLIIFLGGVFLLYKSTSEIHAKVEEAKSDTPKPLKRITFLNAIIQIILLDLLFSFDSILTAVGMTNGVDGALTIMIISVIVSILVIMLFATPVSRFVSKHPSIEMLALSFLILIGFILITEGAFLANTVVMGAEIGEIPKGYLYFAIFFSLGIELLNFQIRKRN